jgi:hypothetical protein
LINKINQLANEGKEKNRYIDDDDDDDDEGTGFLLLLV